MDPRDFDDLLLFLRGEIAMMRERLAAMDELAALTEAGREAGGHWGPDSERFTELIDTVRAYQAFPSGTWWRPSE